MTDGATRFISYAEDMKRSYLIGGLIVGVAVMGGYWVAGQRLWSPPVFQASVPIEDKTLAEHCAAVATERVERLTDGIWLASGFDLANTVLIETAAGHVVVDVGLSPVTSERAKKALLAKTPGSVHTVIYTHSPHRPCRRCSSLG